MNVAVAGIASAVALKAADPTLFPALTAAALALATSSGCRSLHDWLESDDDDRTGAVVLHAFVSRRRRIGVMLHRDGSFGLTVSLPLGSGHIPARTIPIPTSQASAMLNAYACDDPDPSRRALAGRLGSAIGRLAMRARRPVAA